MACRAPNELACRHPGYGRDVCVVLLSDRLIFILLWQTKKNGEKAAKV